MKLIIHTDGGSRGNPGPAAIGVVLEEILSKDLPENEMHAVSDSKRIIAQYGKRIGITSNNIAEYAAIADALHTVYTLQSTGVLKNIDGIHFFSDSSLVVNQLNGVFRIKSPPLRDYLLEIRKYEIHIGVPVRYSAIRRIHNVRADAFVNMAMDVS